MDDGVDPLQSGSVNLAGGWVPKDLVAGARPVPNERNHLVPAGPQKRDQLAPNQPGGAGHRDPQRRIETGRGVPSEIDPGAAVAEAEKVVKPGLDGPPRDEGAEGTEREPVGDAVFQHGRLRAVGKEEVLVSPRPEWSALLHVDEGRAVRAGLVDKFPGEPERTGTDTEAFPVARRDPAGSIDNTNVHPGGRQPLEGAGATVPGMDDRGRCRDVGTNDEGLLGHGGGLVTRGTDRRVRRSVPTSSRD